MEPTETVVSQHQIQYTEEATIIRPKSHQRNSSHVEDESLLEETKVEEEKQTQKNQREALENLIENLEKPGMQKVFVKLA